MSTSRVGPGASGDAAGFQCSCDHRTTRARPRHLSFALLISDSVANGLDRKRAEPGIGDMAEIPFVVPELSLGPITARDVAGVFEGEFPVGKMLGFRVDGLVSHTFFKPYAMTLDFERMKLCLRRG